MKKLFKGILLGWLAYLPMSVVAQSLPVTGAPNGPAGAVTAASSGDDLTQLLQWAEAQQKYLGVSLDFHRVKYAATWWDLISIGQNGLNVGKAGALDYFDLGPGMAAANGKPTRYGQAFPLHLGNLWNNASDHLPSWIGNHVYIAKLPTNLTTTGLFFWPIHGSINIWRWDNDFQAALAYRFGGL